MATLKLFTLAVEMLIEGRRVILYPTISCNAFLKRIQKSYSRGWLETGRLCVTISLHPIATVCSGGAVRLCAHSTMIKAHIVGVLTPSAHFGSAAAVI